MEKVSFNPVLLETILNILVHGSICQSSPFRQIPRSRNTMSKDVASDTYCQIAFQKDRAS